MDVGSAMLAAALPASQAELWAWFLSGTALIAIVPREMLTVAFLVAVWGILRVPANNAVTALWPVAGG